MGDASEKIPVKPSISSREHEELLNIIDTIRSQGVSRYIDIPQIVVCGDQSSGKSSTLEAICGLRFPTSDGLCTRFATEYVLRRSQDDSVNVSIIPQESDEEERSPTELDALRNFEPSTFDLEDFTTISKEAADAMGIDKDGKTFSHDVLHIEISGPTQPHLTLVDLPGLFHAGVDKKGDENVEAVNWLVKHYIENPRSIILAVVSAKNDLNLQKVIKFIRDHDAEGNRTLGVITKPDTIAVDSPTEIQYLKVAQNLEVPYALGWHVVKNRSFEQRDWPTQKRDADEEKWLSKGVWNALNTRQKGVSALRVRLSKVLQNHILSELPSLMKDVETGIADCTKRLETLGMSRSTLEQQRRYLLRASEKFARLISASIDGNYTDAFFGSSETEDGYEKRLRAVAVNIMKDFSADMRLNGHAVRLVDTNSRIPALDLGGPERITKDAFYKKVQFRMSRNSGRELPGLFNPGIIGDLFFDQSEPWRSIITGTQEKLLDAAHTTIGHVLEHAADEATIGGILREIVNPGMEPLEQGLLTKVEEILKPHLKGHPQTYNHYFTDNIQEKRREEDRRQLTQRLETFFNRQVNSENASDRHYNGSFDMKNLLDALVKHKEVNMDRFAAIEAVNAMEGYYKVALKNVVDAFTMYAIEEVLLTRIPSIFTPESVYTLDENTITRVAGESEQSIAERETLTKKLAILKETQKLLHRMDRHKPAGRSVPHQTLESRNNRSARHRPSEPETSGLELEDEEAEGEEKEEESEEEQSESEEQSVEQSDNQSDESDESIEQAKIDYSRCIRRLTKVDPRSKPSLSLLRIMQAEYVVDRMLNFLGYLNVLPPYYRRKRITANLSAVLGALRAIDGLCSDSIGTWDSSVEDVWERIIQTMPWRGSVIPDEEQWLSWRSLVVRFADALAEYLENLTDDGQEPRV